MNDLSSPTVLLWKASQHLTQELWQQYLNHRNNGASYTHYLEVIIPSAQVLFAINCTSYGSEASFFTSNLYKFIV